MNRRLPLVACTAVVCLIFACATSARAADPKPPKDSSSSSDKKDDAKSKSSASKSGSSSTKPYADVIKGYEAIDGMIKMHRKGNKLLAELSSKHLNKDYIVLISIARGIGRGTLLAGMSWGFGDDWIWQFR